MVNQSSASAVHATLAIPVYNEETNIVNTLWAVAEAMRDTNDGYRWEMLVVDDGSSDSTVQQVTAVARALPVPVRLLAHQTNLGLGGALATCFRYSRGDLLVTVDADLSYGPEHINRLVSAWEESRPAVVVASPYAAGGRTVDVPMALEVRSRTANRYLASVSGLPVSTYTGLVRAYSGDFARLLRPTRRGPSINVDVLFEAWRRGLRVLEIPATLDWSGKSDRRKRSQMASWKAVRESSRVLNDGRRLRLATRRMTGRGETSALRLQAIDSHVGDHHQ